MKRLKRYEVTIPINSVTPIELTSLNPVKPKSINENAVEAADIKTASFEPSPQLSLKIE